MKIVKKPWGIFEQFTLNEISTVKILKVKPNQKLSLQFHNKREEMWYFLTDGYAEIGKKTKKVKKGEILKIKKKELHRLFSKNKEVIVLEISKGFFDENDIVRIDDIYGRIK